MAHIGIWTVSYTHLDVYKRQRERTLHRSAFSSFIYILKKITCPVDNNSVLYFGNIKKQQKTMIKEEMRRIMSRKRRRRRGRRKSWFGRLSVGKKVGVVLAGVLICVMMSGVVFVAAKLGRRCV